MSIELDYFKLSEMAVEAGATTPVPPYGEGCQIWSTLEKDVLKWTDGKWIVASNKTTLSRPSIRPSLLLAFADSKVIDPRISNIRNSVATYFNNLGVLSTAKINESRINYNPITLQCNGLLVEESRTNSIPNNTMVGAAAPGTFPTGWTLADPLASMGITREIVGIGQEDGIDYIDLRYTGTVTNTGTIFNHISGSTSIPAIQGQVWTISCFLKLVSGSMNGVSIGNGLKMQVEERSASASLLQNTSLTIPVTNSPLRSQRYSKTFTLNNVATEYIRPSIRFGPSAGEVGQTVDFILRIGCPQLELGSDASSIIKTSTVAVSRASDTPTIAALSPWFNSSEGTILAEWVLGEDVSSAIVYQFSDGTNFDVNRLRYTSGGSSTDTAVITGGVVQSALANSVQNTANSLYKNSFCYKNTGFIRSSDGTSVITEGAGTLPTVTKLDIGHGNNSSQLNGHIKRLAFYPRALLAEEIRGLSS